MAGRFHDGEAAFPRRVVAEHVERIFAGVESGSAGLNRPFVLIGASDIELVATAGQVLVEALVGDDNLFGLSLFLAGHVIVPLECVMPMAVGWCALSAAGDASACERGRKVKARAVPRAFGWLEHY